MAKSDKGKLTPDAKELILCADDRYVCETYIFEPAANEEGLGHLFAVAEIEDRGGVGRELLELVMNAVQKEYYRDSSRSATQSFELALHQANLILHDSVQHGVKDWMGYFHVAICVLVDNTLHVSVAGGATVSLVRKASITEISEGLSTYPVTNPLRTFSQVASGVLASRDVLYIATANFLPLYRSEDLKRFAIDHSANTIATRLQQLYADQGLRNPLSVLIVSMLPQYIVPGGAREEVPMQPSRRKGELVHQASLKPRKPIVLQRSWLRTIFVIAGRVLGYGWKNFREEIWPALRSGSIRLGGQARKGSSVLLSAGKSKVSTIQSRRSINVRGWFRQLPRSSRLFAGLTALFAVALVVSLFLLQGKRAEDATIQRASEQLHAARTAKEAAEAALIYDNRDQARELLAEATTLADQIATTGLYEEEVAALRSEVDTQQDRLQKIVRARGDAIRVLGNWTEFIAQPSNLQLFVIDDTLYTYNPETNAILSLSQEGVADRITQTTEGIGFFAGGVAHPADKTIVLATDAPGVTLFDSQDASLLRQDVAFAASEAKIGSLGVFGNRLYIYEEASDQIFLYNKTLRGYAGGEGWITDEGFPRDDITSIAIDGNIFTLHGDGVVRRLFKGVEAEFDLEPVTPGLAGAAKLITSDEHRFLYVVDPANKRVVIYNKEGELIRQMFLDAADEVHDVAIGPDEETMYVLDRTRVLAVSLVEGEDE